MRRRRRYNRGGNIPYQKGMYNNPYRRGGGINRFHTGGRPHSHRRRNLPRPIPGTGPGMPPPNVDNYARGGSMRRHRVGPYNPGRLRQVGGHGLMWQEWCKPWPECSYDRPPEKPVTVRRGGAMRRRYGYGGGIYAGSPHSCTNAYGMNVPC